MPDNHSTWEKRHITDMFPAGLAVLSIQRLKATTTVWPAVLHDVTLAAKNCLTFKTGEVLHVPMTPLCLCALISKDNLETQTDSGWDIWNLSGCRQSVYSCWICSGQRRYVINISVISGKFWKTIQSCGFTSSQAEQRGLRSSAWCLPQWIFPSW